MRCIAHMCKVQMLCHLFKVSHVRCLLRQVSSTFFACIPFGDGFYWAFFVIATGAACVASQACAAPLLSFL